MRAPSGSSSGRIRSSPAASPEAMIESVAASAPRTPPLTGPSKIVSPPAPPRPAEDRQPARRALVGEPFHRRRVERAHHHHVPGTTSGQLRDPALAEQQPLGLDPGPQHRDQELALLDQLRGGPDDLNPRLTGSGAFGGIEVEAEHRVPGGNQIGGHRQSHLTKPDPSDRR